MNLLKYLFNLAAYTAEQVYDYVVDRGWPVIQRKLQLTYYLLATTIGVAVVFLGAGIAISCAGSEGSTTKDVGKVIIYIGGVLTSVLLSIVWIRLRIYAKMLETATSYAGTLGVPIPLAASMWSTAIRLSPWVSGIAAWITVALVYTMVVPQRYLAASVIAAGCTVGLAYIGAANWFKTRLGRYLAAAFFLCGLVSATATQYVLPEFLKAGHANAESVIGAVEVSAERTEAMNGIAKSAERAANAGDQALLTEKMNERNSMRAHSVTFCRGEFCTPADATRAAALDHDIADLRDGTYWQKRAVVSTPTATASATVTAAPTTPPVVVPPPPVSPPVVTATPPSPPLGTRRAAAAKQLSDLYSDL